MRPRESGIPEFFRPESGVMPVDPDLKRTAKGVIDRILQLRDSL